VFVVVASGSDIELASFAVDKAWHEQAPMPEHSEAGIEPKRVWLTVLFDAATGDEIDYGSDAPNEAWLETLRAMISPEVDEAGSIRLREMMTRIVCPTATNARFLPRRAANRWY